MERVDIRLSLGLRPDGLRRLHAMRRNRVVFSNGYEVVDALLARGDFERAKGLFESLEPLSQLHTSKFQNHGHDHNIKEFERWPTSRGGP